MRSNPHRPATVCGAPLPPQAARRSDGKRIYAFRSPFGSHTTAQVGRGTKLERAGLLP